jgi:putative membrane protein
MGVLFESMLGVPAFLTYFAATLAMVVLFIAIYMRITPYPELSLIREGNVAAAWSLSGALFGFVVPLARSVAQSVNLVDMLSWGAVAFLVQLLVYLGVRMAMPGIVTGIPEGKVAHGLFLGAMSLAAGLLNAACMTY